MSQVRNAIAEAPQSNDQLVHPKGETLPQDQRIYSVKVVTTFLLSGVPLNKIPDFQELLEEHAFRLTDGRHMSDIASLFCLKTKHKSTMRSTVNSF